jgi:methylase of polypeptide subunit release factors
MVEVGEGQAPKVASIFQEAGFLEVDTVRDLGGVNRVVAGAISHA